MIIIPAVDLKDGRCVRLSQGRMEEESVYSEDPVQMAKLWEAKGAERLHVVDLNGAVTGVPVHQSLIKKIARSIRIPVEVGGGIRNLDTIKNYLSSGIEWVILGTVAIGNRGFVEESCRQFPGRIILGIDSRKGRVAIQGWKEEVSLEAVELAKQFEGMGLSAIIFTDIERDGMGTGLNLEMTGALARTISTPVIASGGVAELEDIERLMAYESDGVMGVIVGRAIYSGQIDLGEAIRVTKRVKKSYSP